MLSCLINKCTDLFSLDGVRVLLGKIVRPLKVLSKGIVLPIILQGISSMAFGGWVNDWPIWVCEDRDCDSYLHKENFLGPLVEQKFTIYEHVAAIRPIGLHIDDHRCGESKDFFLYPLFSYIRTRCGSSWNMMGFVSGCHSEGRSKVTIFPLLFVNRTCDPCSSYCAIFPLAGVIRNHFGTDKMAWFVFPLYLGLERNCTVKHALPWPFIRWQTGPCSGGGALWPIAGNFWKECEYEHSYMLWPLIYRFCDRISDPEPSYRVGFLPFFAYESSARKEMTTVLWPFFSHIEMRNRNYVEDQFLWPFFVQGRGENEYVNRWAPFCSHSIRGGHDKRWFLWPLFKVQYWEERGVSVAQEQFFYFLIWKQRQRCLANPCAPESKKMHVWPFFSYWDNGAGQKQFQFLSPLEVFFPANRAVRNMYSPLFAIFKHEQVVPGHTRQSILFDLIASEKTPCSEHLSIGPIFEFERTPCKAKIELLKGLLGFKKEDGKMSLKLLWIGF